MTQRNGTERPRTGRITGWHVLTALLLFFGLVTVVNIFMIRAAISTFGGVETRSSYQAGLDFKTNKARAAEQDALNWTVDASLDGEADARTIAVGVADASGGAVGGLDVEARFAHPTDERLDRAFALDETAMGAYSAGFDLPAGAWSLDLTLSSDGVTKFRSKNRVILK